MPPATLLLADDSITTQRVIELTFADEHVRVLAAADGQQAIQRIDHDRPDIVLADVSMPKVDGYGVATYVKQSAALKHIPVLLLTGAFEPIDEGRARATGCDGVLVKPFEPEKLIGRVKELLAGTRSPELWPKDLPRVETSTPVAVVAPPVAPPAPPPVAHVVAAPPLTVRPAEPTPVVAPPPPPPPPPPPARPATQAAGAVFLDAPPAASRVTPPAPAAASADPLDSELDMLDMALSKLDPTATPHELDSATASDFARDLATLRKVPLDAALPPAEPRASRPSFGDWDLPTKPAHAPVEDALDLGLEPDPLAPIDVVPVEVPAVVVPTPVAPPPALAAAPEPAVILPSTPESGAEPSFTIAPPPVWAAPAPSVQAPVTTPIITPPPLPPAPPLPPKPTLAGAFSALLAAERAQPEPPAAAASPALSEAAIEDVVKRVLARMTDAAVQRVVLDAAERIIREEIDKLKAPDGAKLR